MKKQYNNVILVHTMGKVGSSTIVKSFESLNENYNIFHTHFLNTKRLDTIMDKSGLSLKSLKGHFQDSKSFLEIYSQDTNKAINYRGITLVREPISRNISAFFQNIDSFFPDFLCKFDSKEVTTDDMMGCFLEKYSHNVPIEWFELEFKKVFGTDIFSKSFSKYQGFDIINEPFSFLIIRLEDLNNCHKTAFKQFMGIDDFKLLNANEGKSKTYQKAYQQFKSNLVLPISYVEQMYESQYSRHFYTEDELLSFSQKWLNIK